MCCCDATPRGAMSQRAACAVWQRAVLSVYQRGVGADLCVGPAQGDHAVRRAHTQACGGPNVTARCGTLRQRAVGADLRVGPAQGAPGVQRAHAQVCPNNTVRRRDPAAARRRGRPTCRPGPGHTRRCAPTTRPYVRLTPSAISAESAYAFELIFRTRRPAAYRARLTLNRPVVSNVVLTS